MTLVMPPLVRIGLPVCGGGGGDADISGVEFWQSIEVHISAVRGGEWTCSGPARADISSQNYTNYRIFLNMHKNLYSDLQL